MNEDPNEVVAVKDEQTGVVHFVTHEVARKLLTDLRKFGKTEEVVSAAFDTVATLSEFALQNIYAEVVLLLQRDIPDAKKIEALNALIQTTKHNFN